MTTPSDNPLPVPVTHVERAVRAQLDAAAQGVDARALFAAALARLAADAPRAATLRPARQWKVWAALAPFAIAASLLVALLVIRPSTEVRANPARMIEEAKNVHSQDIDRCYQVRLEFALEFRKRYPGIVPHIEETLWTRGERFWISPSFTGKGSWGRDSNGRVWIAPSLKGAVVFDANELPPLLDEFFKIRAVDLSTLLDEVLKDCDLSWLPQDEDTPANVRRIEAIPKPEVSRSTLKRAVIDIDTNSRLVRNLVLERTLRGEDLATITFSHVESRAQPPGLYEVKDHVADGAPIYHGRDRANREARALLLVRVGLQSLLKKQ